MNNSTTLSNFTVTNIHPKTYNTNPNPAFVTNTVEFINLLNSFFIKALIGVELFILYFLFDFLVFIDLTLELISK